MGSCLSKGAKKAKENEDRAPYAPAKNSLPSGSPQQAQPATGDPSEQTSPGFTAQTPDRARIPSVPVDVHSEPAPEKEPTVIHIPVKAQDGESSPVAKPPLRNEPFQRATANPTRSSLSGSRLSNIKPIPVATPTVPPNAVIDTDRVSPPTSKESSPERPNDFRSLREYQSSPRVETTVNTDANAPPGSSDDQMAIFSVLSVVRETQQEIRERETGDGTVTVTKSSTVTESTNRSEDFHQVTSGRNGTSFESKNVTEFPAVVEAGTSDQENRVSGGGFSSFKPAGASPVEANTDSPVKPVIVQTTPVGLVGVPDASRQVTPTSSSFSTEDINISPDIPGATKTVIKEVFKESTQEGPSQLTTTRTITKTFTEEPTITQSVVYTETNIEEKSTPPKKDAIDKSSTLSEDTSAEPAVDTSIELRIVEDGDEVPVPVTPAKEPAVKRPAPPSPLTLNQEVTDSGTEEVSAAGPTVNGSSKESKIGSPRGGKPESPSRLPGIPRLSTSPRVKSPTQKKDTYETKKTVIQKTTVQSRTSSSSIMETTERVNVTNGTHAITKENGTAKYDNIIIQNLLKTMQSLLYSGNEHNCSVSNMHSLHPGTRKSALEQITEWIGTDGKASQICVVTGSGGVGKTCLATDLCRNMRDDLAASHFFDFKAPQVKHNVPRYAIQSLIYMMCKTIKGYIHQLPEATRLARTIKSASIPDLLENLVFKPIEAHGKTKFILLDALDQCDPSEREEFLGALQQIQSKDYQHVHLVLFTREVNPIVGVFENANAISLGGTNENYADMKKYLKEPLATILDRISLDGGLNQLVKRSSGTFLYAKLVKDIILNEMKGRKIQMREVDRIFPSGLQDLLDTKFGEFQTQVVKATGEASVYSKVLGPIVFSVGAFPSNMLTSCGNADQLRCLSALEPLVRNTEKGYLIGHKCVYDWLLDEQAGDLMVDTKLALEQLAMSCITSWENARVSWVDGQAYMLTHSVRHLTDIPKQQETIANMLCNYEYIAMKFQIPGIHHVDLLSDYMHTHYRILPSSEKLVTLEAYMKKFPNLWEQLQTYKEFVSKNDHLLYSAPNSALQLAANYSLNVQIQQEARAELGTKPWLEELTSVPATPCNEKQFEGKVCDADLSPDGRTLAVITEEDEYKVQLHLINTSTGEERLPSVDLKSLKDRVGVKVKYIADGMNIFASSLTTFVSNKGKQVTSGFDLASIGLKENYSVECCDSSNKHLACSLNTFPFGGRSVHLCVFDLKSKRAVKTLEVLKFRFGGSSQFGIKACHLAREKPLVLACIKQSPKHVLKINLWSLTKWQLVASVEVEDDTISKCFLFGENVFLSGGLQSGQSRETKAYLWNFKRPSEAAVELNTSDKQCILANAKGTTIKTESCPSVSVATLELVEGKSYLDSRASSMYKIRDYKEIGDVFTDRTVVAIIATSFVRLYKFDNLEHVDNVDSSQTLSDVSAAEIMFLPRSDTLSLLTTNANISTCSVKLWDAKNEGILKDTPFREEQLSFNEIAEAFVFDPCSHDIVQSSADGNYILFNDGANVKVWDRVSDSVNVLPSGNQNLSDSGRNLVATSSKDNIAAVVHSDQIGDIFIYDLKTGSEIKHIGLQEEMGVAKVSDMAFLPNQGFLVTSQKGSPETLSVWNAKAGSLISSEQAKVSYGRLSPVSDRIALCQLVNKSEGMFVLRNSDKKIMIKLTLPCVFDPKLGQSDMLFSEDGTTLAGVFRSANMCRIWNAANGENLRDIRCTFVGDNVTLTGMLTTTHLVIKSDVLTVVDVAPGETVAALPLGSHEEHRTSSRRVVFSPRSTTLALVRGDGRVSVFAGRNFTTSKRKTTTLQRMKSFRK